MKEQNKKYLIIGIILVAVIIIIGPKIGLFSVLDNYVNAGNVKVSYQAMTSGCVVRLDRPTDAGTETTWVGVYDSVNNGTANANNAQGLGWLNNETYPVALTFLNSHPVDSSCNFLKIPRYRLIDNHCSFISVYPNQTATNDYLTSAECQLHVVVGNITNPTNQTNQTNTTLPINSIQVFRFGDNACTSLVVYTNQTTANDYTSLSACQENIVSVFQKYLWAWLAGGLLLLYLMFKK